MRRDRPQGALVVGCGSIGRRHLSNLRRLGVPRLFACDPHPERRAYVEEHFEASTFPDFKEALSNCRPDVVLVCSPPSAHVCQAIDAVRLGAHVFLEKPVSDRMSDLEELLAERRKQNVVVQVGYNFRFHTAVGKLKELVERRAVGKILWGRIEAGSYLPDWRPWQDYRESYTARRELGGGIILDGSHELDYALWLFGVPNELTCMAGRVSSLEVNVEDCATVLLRFPDGAQVDVHMDFVERFYSRGCVLAGEEGTMRWDFSSNTVTLQRVGESCQSFAFDSDVNLMYVAELAHFLECVSSGSQPRFSLEDGILSLRLALAARAAAEEKRWMRFE